MSPRRDLEPFDLPETLADRRRVEQRLGRMLAGTISKALITGQSMIEAMLRARRSVPWRMTSASGRMALSVRAVSSSVSPF